MIHIRYAVKQDKDFWFSMDNELSDSEFIMKIRDKRVYIILDDAKPVGVMRYNLMWDITPFLTLIILENNYQGRDFGKQAMLFWENEMKNLGFNMAMTSTRVDEQAQHFYRKLGYIDRGSLFLDNTPLEQPQEIFMIKLL